MKFKDVLLRYKFRFSLTFILLVLEALIWVSFPLVIGLAINDVLNDSYTGLWYLGGLGLAALIINGSRMYFDSHFYAKVYESLSDKLVAHNELASVATKNAQLQMLQEAVEFFENAIPELLNSGLGLVGTLFILFFINIEVFLGCVFVMVLTVVVYAATSKKTVTHNTLYNDELEKRVTILHAGGNIAKHIRRLMYHNTRLSEIEVFNFALVWVAMVALIIYTIISAVSGGETEYGTIFAVVMYVFQFIESSVELPLFYQQGLRLKEIISRIEKGITINQI